MTKEEQIRKALHDMLQNHKEPDTLVGTVVDVYADTATCDVEIDKGHVLHGVRLRSVVDSKQVGILVLPTKGSYVVVERIENSDNHALVVGYSEIDSWALTIEGNMLKVDKEKWIFNGGEQGGLVLIEKLIDKLNKIEKGFNSLLKEFKSHVHTSAAPGSPTTPMVPPSMVLDLQETKKSDIENEKILQ